MADSRPLVDRITNRITSYSAKYLSFGRRFQLYNQCYTIFKSVGQSSCGMELQTNLLLLPLCDCLAQCLG